MSETYKFPNGFEVTICKKQDIIDTINSNILDKEVAYAVIENLEKNIAKLIQRGVWTGIPYIGNVRIPKTKQLVQTQEQQELIQEAKELLDRNDYIVFRAQLGRENAKRIKSNRYFNWISSMSANTNKTLYRRLLRTKGEAYCTVYFHSVYQLECIEEDGQ